MRIAIPVIKGVISHSRANKNNKLLYTYEALLFELLEKNDVYIELHG